MSALVAALQRLREGGLVDESRDSGEVIIRLTELGKASLEGVVGIEEEWDGYWRVVIFDIPEKQRVVRNLLRRKLKEWGFKKWQQSVWITKKNVTLKLRLLINKLGIEGWVSVIESNDKALNNIL